MSETKADNAPAVQSSASNPSSTTMESAENLRHTLPPEPIDKIIGFIPNDYSGQNARTLQTCALVCKSWVPASRSRSISGRYFYINTKASHRNTQVLRELLTAPHSTFLRYMTQASISNLTQQHKRSARLLRKICQAIQNAGTEFISLELIISYDHFRRGNSIDLLPFITQSSRTLRRLSITGGLSTGSRRFGLDFFEALAGCVALEHLVVPENIEFNQRKVVNLPPAGCSALQRVELTPLHSQSVTRDGLGTFLTWLDSAPVGTIEELYVMNSVVASHLAGHPTFATRLRHLHIFSSSSDDPVNFKIFHDLSTIHVELKVDWRYLQSSGQLETLFTSLSTYPDSLQKITIFITDGYLAYGGDAAWSLIDGALAQFAGNHPKLGLEVSKLCHNCLTEEEARGVFGICGEMQRFQFSYPYDEVEECPVLKMTREEEMHE